MCTYFLKTANRLRKIKKYCGWSFTEGNVKNNEVFYGQGR